jgi:hypothetical protein
VKGASYTSNANRSWPLLICLLGAACGDSSVSELDRHSPDVGEIAVTGVNPTLLLLDSTFVLRVFGSGFEPGWRVVLTVNGEPTPKVRTNATLFVNPRELDATITTAADAPDGPYDIVVEGRNGKQGMGTELVDGTVRRLGAQPASAMPGDEVWIVGSGFSPGPWPAVTIHGRPAVVRSVSDTTIVVLVPVLTEVGTAEVWVAFGSSLYGVTHLDVQENRRPDPSIIAVAPDVAPWGSDIMIVGSNFTSNPELVSVELCPFDIYDGYANPNHFLCHAPLKRSVSDTRMTVRVAPRSMGGREYWGFIVSVVGAQNAAVSPSFRIPLCSHWVIRPGNPPVCL